MYKYISFQSIHQIIFHFEKKGIKKQKKSPKKGIFELVEDKINLP